MDSHLLRFNKDKTLVFIDCETHNLCLNSCHNLPWQIAMIKVKGNKVVASKDFYIKWDTHLKIGKEAAKYASKFFTIYEGEFPDLTIDKSGRSFSCHNANDIKLSGLI